MTGTMCSKCGYRLMGRSVIKGTVSLLSIASAFAFLFIPEQEVNEPIEDSSFSFEQKRIQGNRAADDVSGLVRELSEAVRAA